MTKEELLSDLPQFTGTENYYTFTPFAPLVLTDGAKYLAENAGAFWLMDIIASIFEIIEMNGAGFAYLTRQGDKALFELDDGNGDILYKEDIEFTDFPLEKILLYVMPGQDNWVIMLPSEY